MKQLGNNLKSVILLHRHGDRTATDAFDDGNVFYWLKYGLGRLTDVN
ncbi:hypothetical protein B4U80_15040 [Leptotrombidium deliense]|uniref:Lysosomal acid phosphatase-like protein n=1 Tax=Leptotrombidium deliense TaxID=299467 RepID=A0A443RSW5_9ACAR|nr:hypothetical protein B4U80_15040 [Leptotrombidium deliense]